MYYTTPLLVFYAIVLLLIQYLYNLDLTEDELESHIDAGLIRYSPVGARVLAIVIKVLSHKIERDRETDTQRDTQRHTHTETDRHTETET